MEQPKDFDYEVVLPKLTGIDGRWKTDKTGNNNRQRRYTCDHGGVQWVARMVQHGDDEDKSGCYLQVAQLTAKPTEAAPEPGARSPKKTNPQPSPSQSRARASAAQGNDADDDQPPSSSRPKRQAGKRQAEAEPPEEDKSKKTKKARLEQTAAKAEGRPKRARA